MWSRASRCRRVSVMSCARRAWRACQQGEAWGCSSCLCFICFFALFRYQQRFLNTQTHTQTRVVGYTSHMGRRRLISSSYLPPPARPRADRTGSSRSSRFLAQEGHPRRCKQHFRCTALGVLRYCAAVKGILLLVAPCSMLCWPLRALNAGLCRTSDAVVWQRAYIRPLFFLVVASTESEPPPPFGAPPFHFLLIGDGALYASSLTSISNSRCSSPAVAAAVAWSPCRPRRSKALVHLSRQRAAAAASWLPLSVGAVPCDQPRNIAPPACSSQQLTMITHKHAHSVGADMPPQGQFVG